VKYFNGYLRSLCVFGRIEYMSCELFG